MPRAAKPTTTKVRIAPHRSVVVNGRNRVAGELVDVDAKDAESLIAEGYAEPPDRQTKRRRKTKTKPEDRAPMTPATVTAEAEREAEQLPGDVATPRKIGGSG